MSQGRAGICCVAEIQNTVLGVQCVVLATCPLSTCYKLDRLQWFVVVFIVFIFFICWFLFPGKVLLHTHIPFITIIDNNK